MSEQREALQSIYEAKGREGLVEWVAEQRKQLWMVDCTPDVIKRHIDLVNRGEWPEELDPLDWRDPQTLEALRSYLSDRLLMLEGSELSPELQHLAGQLLTGTLKPRRKRKSSPQSTAENIRVALDCIIALRKIGIAAQVSKDWRVDSDLTGCAIVAEGLHVSEPTVENWWKAHRKAEKAKHGVK